MKIRLPMVVEDRLTSMVKEMRFCEGVVAECEDTLLDGPVGSRVAVVDFEPGRGTIAPGARLLRPGPGRTVAEFELPEWGGGGSPAVLEDPHFIQVNVFSTVTRVLSMYEEPDCLGRRITWGFGGPQLLVVPRAGELNNAWYDRAARSLQFFYFDDVESSGGKVYTALSRDIVAHETGHAILDGIAPDLYDALLPQSLGLHEAVADLTSLLLGLRSGTLRQTILDATGGSIAGENALNWVALEFGWARSGGKRPLRNLNNDNVMPEPDSPERVDPYALSLVLNGALYKVLVKEHEAVKAEIMAREGVGEYSASGKALFVAGEVVKRLALRGLDYLPPGEVSFADFGRAALAADRAMYPGRARVRGWFSDELRRRGVAGAASESGVPQPAGRKVPHDLDELVTSDRVAWRFAEENRELLAIPPGVSFVVKPRLDVTKARLSTGVESGTRREVLFKVSWEEVERNPVDGGMPSRRRVTRGTTLVIDAQTGRASAVLTSGCGGKPEEAAVQAADRTMMVRQIVRDGLLRLVRPSAASRAQGGMATEISRSAIVCRVADGALRPKGTARLLHIVGRGE